jgi:hypothetical protein
MKESGEIDRICGAGIEIGIHVLGYLRIFFAFGTVVLSFGKFRDIRQLGNTGGLCLIEN